jgi:hypothetical protein
LKAYWKVFEEQNTAKEAIKINQHTYDEIARLVRQPLTASNLVVPTADRQAVPQQISGTAGTSQPVEVEDWQLTNVLGSHRAKQFAIQYGYLEPQPNPQASTRSSEKRKHDGVGEAGPARARIRHCTYCKSSECSGRWGVTKCPQWQAAQASGSGIGVSMGNERGGGAGCGRGASGGDGRGGGAGNGRGGGAGSGRGSVGGGRGNPNGAGR